ncbi:MAG: helix-turn-helix domain-containing protein [Acidimicrobiia bacterium]|nr:helix-turn-helix domain-containing protein [Acidimicrobiia bacterium]MYE67640.1 helix-turn-helix domain-containing protein [Acidimicrobiia bacterium]MYJ13129.1 helix-turn-helix domain-containing protein [Acidimicrobiia bacterium]
MQLLSVSGAAAELGVSPRRVRQMLSTGVLAGQRVGGAWVIEKHAVRATAGARRPAHRPWSAASAWAVLALACGEEPAGSAAARRRARERYDRGLLESLDQLRERAELRRFYAHPAAVPRIADRPGVVRTGASAAPEHGLGLAGAGPLVAYVRAEELARLLEDVPMEERAGNLNVCLRAVQDVCWPFPSDVSVAPLPVVAVDLAESPNVRERRLGLKMLGYP